MRLRSKLWRKLPQPAARAWCRMTGGHWWHGMPMNQHCCHCGHRLLMKATGKMMAAIRRMDIGEFRADGYLQEANRLFFHPLGLALEVVVDDETGETRLGGVWDYRDDPEGMFFGVGELDNDEARRKAATVGAQRDRLRAERERVAGASIQEIGRPLVPDDGESS